MSAEGLGVPVLWRVTIDDLQIRVQRGTSVAYIDGMRVSYSVLELIGGQLDIEHLGMTRPLLLTRQYTDGSMNVLEVARPGPPKGSRFELTEIVVQPGTLIICDDRIAISPANNPCLPNQFQQNISQWIDQVFSSDSEFDTSKLFQGVPRTPRKRVVSSVTPGGTLMDRTEVDANLVARPAGAIETTIDEFEVHLYTVTLAPPLVTIGERMHLS